MRSRRGEDCFQPRPSVRGAADHLQRRGFADIDLADPQAIGVGMRRGLENLRDAEGAKLFGGIVDMLDLEPDPGQRLDDHVERRLGFEMGFQPGQGEFHGLVSNGLERGPSVRGA